MKEVGAAVHDKEERTTQVLSNIVNNTIAMKLEKTIKAEMKQTVLPGMEKVACKYFDSLNNQVAQVKLSLLMVKLTNFGLDRLNKRVAFIGFP